MTKQEKKCCWEENGHTFINSAHFKDGRFLTNRYKEMNYRRGCRLASQDKERDQELKLWDSIFDE